MLIEHIANEEAKTRTGWQALRPVFAPVLRFEIAGYLKLRRDV